MLSRKDFLQIVNILKKTIDRQNKAHKAYAFAIVMIRAGNFMAITIFYILSFCYCLSMRQCIFFVQLNFERLIYVVSHCFWNFFFSRTMNYLCIFVPFFILAAKYTVIELAFHHILRIFYLLSLLIINHSFASYLFRDLERSDIRPSFIILYLFFHRISNRFILTALITCCKLMRVGQYFMNRLL